MFPLDICGNMQHIIKQISFYIVVLLIIQPKFLEIYLLVQSFFFSLLQHKYKQ